MKRFLSPPKNILIHSGQFLVLVILCRCELGGLGLTHWIMGGIVIRGRNLGQSMTLDPDLQRTAPGRGGWRDPNWFFMSPSFAASSVETVKSDRKWEEDNSGEVETSKAAITNPGQGSTWRAGEVRHPDEQTCNAQTPKTNIFFVTLISRKSGCYYGPNSAILR